MKIDTVLCNRKMSHGYSGDRTTAPSLLVRAFYQCDHQTVVTSIEVECSHQDHVTFFLFNYIFIEQITIEMNKACIH